MLGGFCEELGVRGAGWGVIDRWWIFDMLKEGMGKEHR